MIIVRDQSRSATDQQRAAGAVASRPGSAPTSLSRPGLPPSETLGREVQQRLVGFVRHVRANGFRVGIAEELDAQRVALCFGIGRPDLLRLGLRSLLCADVRDWRRFDELFDSWWLPGTVRGRVQASRAGGPVPDKIAMQDGAARREQPASADGIEVAEATNALGTGSQAGASAAEGRERADFGTLGGGEQQRAMERLVEALARRMRRRITRRERVRRDGRRIHLRRTVRNSLAQGGMPLRLAFRERRRRPPRLILIADVSRSMSMYSLLFLRFARGLVTAFRDAAAFACHTRLVPITEALRQPDGQRLAESLALISLGWSGGTRLGESLASFNREHGRLLGHGAVVIIVSDGLDTGPPERLAAALTQIRGRARRLIWLNPLLGRPGYEPRSGAMQAALPHLDLFAPANDLQSLAALEPILAEL
jgi:uncharacterized protein with von Willebrand factor type A (vWA) domain